jgi:pimeloyl-ACP methyl ester carboxylesterase
MYVEDRGQGAATLALHGLGGGAYFFRGFADRLQFEYRIVTVDLPGTGRSTSETVTSMDRWVEELGALVDRLGAGPVVIIGHSMGTMLALKAWAAWRAKIRGLVFVGGLPRVRPLIRERLSQRLTALTGASDLSGWGPKVSPGVFSPASFRDRPETVALFERVFETQPLDVYTRCCQILLDADASSIVPTVTVPAMVLTGTDDQYAPPVAVTEFARQLPTQPRLEIVPDCGHLPFLEQPAAFADAVKSFLRTC